MSRVAIIALAALLVAAVAAPDWAAEPKTAAQAKPAAVRTVLSADGIPIAYAVQGAGEPAIVFIHCWSCDRSYWANQVDVFAKKHLVVTLDLAGHGDSGAGRAEWTIQSFARDVAAVVTALDPKRVILVGHSMGGPVALEAARLMPERVIGIVGVDTYRNLEQGFPEERKQQMLTALQSNFPVVAGMFVRSMFPARTDSALVARIAGDMASEPPDIAIGAMKSNLDYDPLPALAAITVPVRTINGDLFPTDPEEGKRHTKSFGVTIMPGRGHFPHLEDPKAFNEILARMIDEIVKTK